MRVSRVKKGMDYKLLRSDGVPVPVGFAWFRLVPLGSGYLSPAAGIDFHGPP